MFVLSLSEGVERLPDGIPKAWRLFSTGDNHFSLNGAMHNLHFSAGDFENIVKYAEGKGNRIPVDSRHFIGRLATKLDRDESELLDLLPDGLATMGFGTLQLRSDGLWLSDVEFVPAANDLLREGVLKYFSPVVRGLDRTEPLRVTSVALDNEPCLARIPELTHTVTMSELTDIFKTFFERKNKMEAETIESVARDVLELSEADTAQTVRAKIVELKTKASLADELGEKVKALELAEDAAKKSALLKQMLDEQRISNFTAESDWIKGMSYAELAEASKAFPQGAILQHAPCADRECEKKEPGPILKRLGIRDEELNKKTGKEQ